MTWAQARTALVAEFDGQQITATGMKQETLRCVEFPPAGADQPYPFAYINPPGRSVHFGASSLRHVVISQATLRFFMGADNREEAAKRMEAWVVQLTDVMGFDATQAALAAVGLSVQDVEFTEFSTFGPDGAPPYGFEMSIPANIFDARAAS